MVDEDDALRAAFTALRDEARAARPQESLRDAVLARLDDTPATDEDRLVLAPDVEAELAGRPVGDWLREERAALLASPPEPWSRFSSLVMERVAHAPASEPDDALAPERGVTVAELLREERAAELGRMEGRWQAFAAQIDAEIRKRPVAAAGSAEQAVALLRADVDDELDALAPAFEERFGEEVDRKIFAGGRALSPWARLRSWLRELGTPGGIGVGVGLAGAAAAAALFVLPLGSEPDLRGAASGASGGEAMAELTGEVSVDAVSFEGDVMMIPDEGVTVVVLSDARGS